MPSSVYIETTIVSYLTAWPSRDVVRLAHETITREWWAVDRPNYRLCTSDFVIEESSAGDSSAAVERLKALEGIDRLWVTAAALDLAEQLVEALNLPERARLDAAHVAVAAVHAIDFLLTWNCRHLANANLASKIERACLASGYVSPRIITPEQLRGAS